MVIFCFQLFERQVAINRQYAKKEWLSANSQGKLYYFFNISKHFNELLLFVCCLIVRPFHKLTMHLHCGVKVTAGNLHTAIHSRGSCHVHARMAGQNDTLWAGRSACGTWSQWTSMTIELKVRTVKVFYSHFLFKENHTFSKISLSPTKNSLCRLILDDRPRIG